MDVSPLIDSRRITSVTRASFSAIDDCLGGNAVRLHALVEDVEAISQSRCSALSPTGATILGNVLILAPGKIVDSIYITPEEIVRHLLIRDIVLRTWGVNFLTILEKVFDPLSLRRLIVSQEASTVFCLGIWPIGEVIPGIVFFFLSSCMDLAFRILWHGPCTIRFNTKSILASENAEETILSPVISP